LLDQAQEILVAIVQGMDAELRSREEWDKSHHLWSGAQLLED